VYKKVSNLANTIGAFVTCPIKVSNSNSRNQPLKAFECSAGERGAWKTGEDKESDNEGWW